MAAPQYNPELLEAARGGDEPAIASLLALAQPDVRRYALYSCSTTEDAQDAVQETLWILYRRIGSLRAVTSFSGWLFAIVRRECSRLARRMMGHGEDLEDSEAVAALAHRPALELRIDLARAIQSLSGHYREIVILRDIQELTIDEIAARLGRSREAVKANLHRARVLLREYLTR
ncbi:MAG: sigma-70 family RNA polymerase sigma factor [Terracidiphilus sp.]|nr:sigma-70 family RNA polymerase sigma factor [Terracidiphilus sp.]